VDNKDARSCLKVTWVFRLLFDQPFEERGISQLAGKMHVFFRGFMKVRLLSISGRSW
jgi:hypothetical protein